MKSIIKIFLIILCGSTILWNCGSQNQSKSQLEIAVIPKGTTHDFWKSVHSGAKQAGEELKVKIYWNGPAREGDRDGQISIVEDFITRKIDGVVLAPLDDKALVPIVEKLKSKNIPCVIFDSGIQTEQFISFVGTDNYNGGVIAARRMAQAINNQGNVLVLKYAAGSASTTLREKGFMDEITKNHPNIKILDTKYGLDTVETALQAAEDLLTKNKDVQGFFACNESTAVGMLQAVVGQKRNKEITLVGFDASMPLINGLKNGEIDALVVQNPFNMGYLGVQTIVKSIKGEKNIAKNIDTGATLVTKDNLNTPEIKKLLNL